MTGRATGQLTAQTGGRATNLADRDQIKGMMGRLGIANPTATEIPDHTALTSA